MRQALQERWLLADAQADPALVQRFIAANVSEKDAAVIATAIMREATLLLADDRVVRDEGRALAEAPLAYFD